MYSEFSEAFDLAAGRDLYSNPSDYGWEPHQVTTEDGFILTLFKIFKRDSVSQSQPVLWQFPGVTLGGDETGYFQFAENFPTHSKMHMLSIVDLGFEVWTNSFRGTRYNQQHLSITNPAEYWDFTYDELADYDMPVVVDYVYNQSGQ